MKTSLTAISNQVQSTVKSFDQADVGGDIKDAFDSASACDDLRK